MEAGATGMEMEAKEEEEVVVETVGAAGAGVVNMDLELGLEFLLGTGATSTDWYVCTKYLSPPKRGEGENLGGSSGKCRRGASHRVGPVGQRYSALVPPDLSGLDCCWVASGGRRKK